MNNKQQGNPFHNSAFNKNAPEKQKDKPMEQGEQFIEEEMENEIDEIDEIERQMEDAKGSKTSKAELKDEVRELENELKAVRETLLRAHAEMENVRRRSAIDVEKAHKYSIEKLAKDLLPVVDSLEKALELGAEQAKALHEGVELTHRLLIKVLENHGVKVIAPLHQTFDPNLHEAISTQPDSTVAPKTVINVFQKGYELKGRLIRPALVVVAQ